MNKKIQYLKGDATRPQGDGKKIICHICNNIGAWGAGFVLTLSKRWKEPEIAYKNKTNYSLTDVDFINVTDNITIANMIAQNGIRNPNNKKPINYAALRICLNEVNDFAYRNNASIHMPKIGTGLAGGDWNIIEKIIDDIASVPVYVYEL